MRVLGFHHTSFTVSDLDRSVAFYQDVLGMDVVAQLETTSEAVRTVVGMPEAHLKVALLKAGGDVLELIQYLSPKGNVYDFRTCDVGLGHIALGVSDVEEAYQILSAKGVHFKSAPQLQEEAGASVRSCYMSDPDGITVELIQIGR